MGVAGVLQVHLNEAVIVEPTHINDIVSIVGIVVVLTLVAHADRCRRGVPVPQKLQSLNKVTVEGIAAEGNEVSAGAKGTVWIVTH